MLDIVSGQNDLILHITASIDFNTVEELYTAHNLLPQEVTDLHGLLVVRNSAVDGEMSIHQTHLVFKSLGEVHA